MGLELDDSVVQQVTEIERRYADQSIFANAFPSLKKVARFIPKDEPLPPSEEGLDELEEVEEPLQITVVAVPAGRDGVTVSASTTTLLEAGSLPRVVLSVERDAT